MVPNLNRKEAEVAEAEKIKRKQRKAEERCFNVLVDVSKVSMSVIKQWMVKYLEEHLPDDDVAVEFIYELLVGAENNEPEIRVIREQMNDFLGKDTSRAFCLELWQLLLSAQESPDGVPQQLVDDRTAQIEKDEKARREANLILELLRPKLSLSKTRTRVSFKEPESERKSALPSKANRVNKPDRKTNYNRS
ncbi:PWI domain-containing protein [Metschnikowia bicuspidata var. bicuspidata NRRL YB-4993]|uniref:U1 small nuclear ribonucleoprotein component SNU71 n=1 Tax=Metschnikowia bicuspidata var. bicuspidata NRRL YB-4993 TaxID=869754 RepID=A0A1A0H1Z6_9ASCO|nr:PWI domain-containing protein [Metschnikowia bicuspidata var. bicuspidata NRRL YB-4993]OBA18054.1 PWI domain-containing protein [Metschnikowia bicuspidata var. bicuspidata NRRL YB-4993]